MTILNTSRPPCMLNVFYAVENDELRRHNLSNAYKPLASLFSATEGYLFRMQAQTGEEKAYPNYGTFSLCVLDTETV